MKVITTSLVRRIQKFRSREQLVLHILLITYPLQTGYILIFYFYFYWSLFIFIPEMYIAAFKINTLKTNYKYNNILFLKKKYFIFYYY